MKTSEPPRDRERGAPRLEGQRSRSNVFNFRRLKWGLPRRLSAGLPGPRDGRPPARSPEIEVAIVLLAASGAFALGYWLLG